MTPNNQPMHDMLKVLSGFSPETPEEDVREYWTDIFPNEIEKPCGVLRWCPYGPLVEQFPVRGHDDGTWEAMSEPEHCPVFGHTCPVFYVAEPFADMDAVTANCVCEDCRKALENGESDD